MNYATQQVWKLDKTFVSPWRREGALGSGVHGGTANARRASCQWLRKTKNRNELYEIGVYTGKGDVYSSHSCFVLPQQLIRFLRSKSYCCRVSSYLDVELANLGCSSEKTGQYVYHIIAVVDSSFHYSLACTAESIALTARQLG